MNKKGFAISVVLYIMVLLVIGIFYLLLGIVRHRYTIGDNLKGMIINSIDPGGPPITNFEDIFDYAPDSVTANDGARCFYGKIDNNYVWYSGKLWRVVCINEDGTIKMVTQGNMTSVAWSVAGDNTDYSISQVRSWLNNEFLPTLYDSDSLLVDSSWDYTTYESSSTKLTPVNTINGEKVGLLGVYDYYNSQKRLNGSVYSFLDNGYDWWTMSPQTDSSKIWYVNCFGYIDTFTPIDSLGVRPVINLKAGVEFTGGKGTKNNPFVIEGGGPIVTESQLLSKRISGEYINFNDSLYRIVDVEEINGVSLTKVTLADYSLNATKLTTSLAFGTNANQRIYSLSYGIGLYLEEWYQADSTNEIYSDIYIKDLYKQMIATSTDDKVKWYTGPTSGTGYDYTLAKTGTPVSATIGLGYYGELFSSQFGEGDDFSSSVWLMTIFSNSNGWSISSSSYVYNDVGPFSSRNRGPRPSFYLKSNVRISNGTGMPHNPYEITM